MKNITFMGQQEYKYSKWLAWLAGFLAGLAGRWVKIDLADSWHIWASISVRGHEQIQEKGGALFQFLWLKRPIILNEVFLLMKNTACFLFRVV